MSIAVIAAFLLSMGIYLREGFRLRNQTKDLADMLPIMGKSLASVKNSSEFSASTVATTISLATLIVAYFELVPTMGLWLLWTVFTTALGIGMLALASGAIWRKMSRYDHRPSLHEFLGREFSSPLVAFVGASCTSVGFLLIFAVELTVGARFLADLVPEVPRWITVCVLSFVGFLYTSQGGFRAVIRTDQIQMRFIWLFIVAVLLFIGFYVWGHPHSFSLIPRDLYSFGYQPGLGAFIFGVTVMNVPTHISNMSIWQRIAGANDPKTVVRGLWKSTFSSAISWTALVLIALLTFTVSVPETGQNLLVVFLRDISAMPGGRITVFFVAMGLYGAMLSTASTQLIVVSHTVSEDILAPSRRLALADRVSRKGELAYSRRILFLSAVLAVGFVELLNLIGFSIADLVFSIYGGQLVLFPIIMLALFKDRSRLGAYRVAANWAIVFGFMAGWGAALVGNFWHIPYLVFLSPALSIGSSSLVLFVGRFLPWLLGRK